MDTKNKTYFHLTELEVEVAVKEYIWKRRDFKWGNKIEYTFVPAINGIGNLSSCTVTTWNEE